MVGTDLRIKDLRTWTVAVLTAATLLTLGGGCEAAKAADPVYGVTAASRLKARDFSAMKRGGIQVLRLEISWSETKRKGGGLDWSRTDRLVRQAAEQDLEVVPYLTGLPRWAKSCRRRCRAPDDPETDGWLRFVKGAVERYGAGGDFWPVGSPEVTLPIKTWQLWNIANKNVSARAYGTLLEATYRMIKLADPDAYVLTGGLSYGGGKRQTKPTKFLRELLRSDGKKSFSAVAIGPQSRSVRRVKAQVKDVSKVLAATERANSGIWVIPIGWASNRGKSAMSVGLTGQKRRLKHSMSMLRRRGLGVQGVFWSRWRDGGGGCSWCRHSGLLAGAGKPKPAWGAYKKFLGKSIPDDPDLTGPGPSFFGVSPEAGQLTPRDFDLMEAAGVGSVRFLVAQQEVVSAGGSFDWGPTDEVFRQLAEHGIEPLPLLFGDPKVISRVNDPAAMEDWRRFAAAAVSRYRPGSPFWSQFAAASGVAPLPPDVWQLYNEQNTWLYWPGGPSVTQFAKLLDVSAQAIRGADPNAKIMLGGMFGDDGMNGIPVWEFLRQLYRVPGARDDFDIVAVHPYSFSLDGIAWQVGNTRDAMAAANDAATPIWITEISWGSRYDDDPTKQSWWERDPQGQADMLTSAWNLLLRERKAWNLGGIFWYTWRDTGFHSCAFCESAGLLENNFASKPSFAAFSQLAASAGTG